MEELLKLIREARKAITEGDTNGTIDALAKLEKNPDWKTIQAARDSGSDLTKVPGYDEVASELDSLTVEMDNQPLFRNKKFIEDLQGGLGDAFKLYANIAETGAVKAQRIEADKQLEQLKSQKPAAPNVPTISPAIIDNTERARRELQQVPTGITSAAQRNLQLLQQAVNNAKTATTGNAASFGSAAQGAINQARQSNNELAGMQMQDRQARVGNMNEALRLEEASRMARLGQRANIYGQALDSYNQLAKSVGLLGQSARDNELINRRNYAEVIPGLTKFSAGLGYGTGQLLSKLKPTPDEELTVDPREVNKIQDINNFENQFSDSLGKNWDRTGQMIDALRRSRELSRQLFSGGKFRI